MKENVFRCLDERLFPDVIGRRVVFFCYFIKIWSINTIWNFAIILFCWFTICTNNMNSTNTYQYNGRNILLYHFVVLRVKFIVLMTMSVLYITLYITIYYSRVHEMISIKFYVHCSILKHPQILLYVLLKLWKSLFFYRAILWLIYLQTSESTLLLFVIFCCYFLF